MSNVVKIDEKEDKTNRQSMIAVMAQKMDMDPDVFANTVRSTVMPANHTKEQFAALMMVAHEYDLNPIVKEIYAFPAKGGGIVPIVSIDGWVNLVNSHSQCDGFEFEFEHNDKGDLVSCTCRMHRKDRSKPVTVTEYLAECRRNSEPWKMEHRMLRHKAMIQAARYAFGFSGIYDEDEGAKIAESTIKDVTPPAPPPPPSLPSEQAAPVAPPPPPVSSMVGDDVEEATIVELPDNIEDVVGDIAERLSCAQTIDLLNEIWSMEVDEIYDSLPEPLQDILEAGKEQGKAGIAHRMMPVV